MPMMMPLAARRHLLGLLLLVLIPGWVAPLAADEAEDSVDHVNLAARLIGDGRFERAATALSRADPADDDVDAARYYTLRGLVNLRRGRQEAAVEDLEGAIDRHAEITDDKRDEETERRYRLAHLYLGQAHFERGDHAAALVALDEAGEVAARIPAVHGLRAQAFWALDQPVAAVAALNRASARFPDDLQFQRRKIFYLVELGFYQQAAELGRGYLRHTDASPEDYLAIGRALRQGGQHDAALSILERGRLRYPATRELAIELSHVYLDRGDRGIAADLLTEVSVHQRGVRAEAAELQRRAGRLQRALMLNADIDDQEKKLRQRLSILVEKERWREAASMGAALGRHGVLEAEEVRYAYAYAQFKAGDYAAADRTLDAIESGDMFRKATELRRVMEQCRAERWQCL